jgi:hypothetical protein
LFSPFDFILFFVPPIFVTIPNSFANCNHINETTTVSSPKLLLVEQWTKSKWSWHLRDKKCYCILESEHQTKASKVVERLLINEG